MRIDYINEALASISDNYDIKTSDTGNNDAFSIVLNNAINNIKQTNDLINNAREEEIKYSLGITDNIHQVMIAQSKASTALQFTVAIYNKAIEAYKQLMAMQF